MKKKLLPSLWGGMFILCAGLGFFPEPEGVVHTLLTILSILFFVPPFVMLWDASKTADKHSIALIRNLSALSLLLTLVLLIGNLLSVAAGETLGNILYYILIIISSPMICSGYWALSLFLWACLLIMSQKAIKAIS